MPRNSQTDAALEAASAALFRESLAAGAAGDAEGKQLAKPAQDAVAELQMHRDKQR